MGIDEDMFINTNIQKVLDEFFQAYSIQKDMDLDNIECVVYSQGKKTIFYFREKRKEIRQYGPNIIQD